MGNGILYFILRKLTAFRGFRIWLIGVAIQNGCVLLWAHRKANILDEQTLYSGIKSGFSMELERYELYAIQSPFSDVAPAALLRKDYPQYSDKTRIGGSEENWVL